MPPGRREESQGLLHGVIRDGRHRHEGGQEAGGFHDVREQERHLHLGRRKVHDGRSRCLVMEIQLVGQNKSATFTWEEEGARWALMMSGNKSATFT
eukprot:CAMPEP_0182862770 /NCGR_PEP_ID=MMETSP0034_2-20130328/6263_1 /TAXON_ID=156128 /ORGANISM="Nephroselmis pyriformis, Strain CCMP717" /LENGTH=95 /DNA_ID=CAMNT_0024994891 /DNA_START=195 /DNA_END=483 /DNA_ORIENTATION=-